MIEHGTVDGHDAVLSYVNDMMEPVDKEFAALLVASLDDGRKIFLNVPQPDMDLPVGDAWKEGDPRGQPDNPGQFGPGGSSSKAEERNARALAALTPEHKQRLNPEVINVGGDNWNKGTAIRLEHEYQEAKPKLTGMLDNYAAGKTATGQPADQDVDEPLEHPIDWDSLSADAQQEIEDHYYADKLQDYIDSETESWQENGGAEEDAKAQLTLEDDWIKEALEEWMDPENYDEEDNPTPQYPFTAEQLADAITVHYNGDGQGTGTTQVIFSSGALQEPAGKTAPKEQMTLPGVEQPDYSKLLTKDMRTELTVVIKGAFDKAAEKKAGDMEAPTYIVEQAQDFMKDNWSSNMSDKDKFQYGKIATGVIHDIEERIKQEGSGVSLGVPRTYDPLNETSGNDYRMTQKIARTMSIDRTMQVFAERGIKARGIDGNKIKDAPDIKRRTIARVDGELWEAWKGSSTSEAGKALQVATAEELGGRLNPKTGHGGKVQLDIDEVAFDAETTYAEIGGWEGLKAYVRAKWETTQFLLDKAGKNQLELYRGVSLDADMVKGASVQMVKGYQLAYSMNVVRNGAASTSVNRDIANNWSQGSAGKVTLRAIVPRTAAVSVPAYGINVQSEQEVVVAGTAWVGWDAWVDKAPPLDEVRLN